MRILKGIIETHEFITKEKRSGKRIGLVPTMGALHLGHLRLIQKSIDDNDLTVVSIFVNPLQFNNPSDLEKYPRSIENDIELLRTVGCDLIFIPSNDTMYPKSPTIELHFGELDMILEGQFRPGHFNGVGIVVAKLFNIIQPDQAYFGQKDYQQFQIIKQIVETFNMPIELNCVEIIRDASGLALSSRNQRLSDSEKKVAPQIFETLKRSALLIQSFDLPTLRLEAKNKLTEHGITLEYLELAERENFKILSTYKPDVPSILLIAAYIGDIRLIDNLFV